jgi:hypothetical protein
MTTLTKKNQDTRCETGVSGRSNLGEASDESVEIGQHDVKTDQVKWLIGGFAHGLFAVNVQHPENILRRGVGPLTSFARLPRLPNGVRSLQKSGGHGSYNAA